jgi:branched-chain amino acid transport system substrate-binding protein
MRSMNFRRSILFLVSVLALFVLFAAVSCGGNKEGANGGGGGATPAAGDTTGVTDTSIKIGSLLPLTGASAAVGVPMIDGMKAYVEWVNRQGGIYGRQLVLDIGDSASNGPQAADTVRNLVEQDKVFLVFGTVGGGVEDAVAEYLTEHNVPDLFSLAALSKFAIPPAKNRFTSIVDYATEGKNFAQYIFENYNGKKLGILAQNDDSGKEGETATRERLQELGADIEISTEYFDPSVTDVSAQTQRLKGDSVDVVLYWGGLAAAANMMRTARETLSWDVPFILTSGCETEITAALAGMNNVEGAVSAGISLQSWQTDYPEMAQAIEDMASVAPNLQFNQISQAGWQLVASVVMLLKQAGPNLTREDLIAAAESACNKTPLYEALLMVPSATSPTDHQFAEVERLVKGTVDRTVDPPVFHWVPFGDLIGSESTTDCTPPTPPADATNQPGPSLTAE